MAQGRYTGGGGRSRLDGTAKMAARLERLATRFPDDVARALYFRAEKCMTRSKRDFVPVDLGPLRSSGHVEPPVRSMGRFGNTIKVALVYGGPAAPYALAVHEHPSAHSPPSWRGVVVTFSPPGHGAKYLERPLMETSATLATDIASDVRFDKTAR